MKQVSKKSKEILKASAAKYADALKRLAGK